MPLLLPATCHPLSGDLLDNHISAPRATYWAASIPWSGPTLGSRKALVLRVFRRCSVLKGARTTNRMYAKLGTTPHGLIAASARCGFNDTTVDILTLDADLDVYAYEFEQHVKATFAAAQQCVRSGGHVIFVGTRAPSKESMACVPKEWRVKVHGKFSVAADEGVVENGKWLHEGKVLQRMHVIVTVWKKGSGQTMSVVREEE